MHVSLFDYHLPPERIAQHSTEPRDHAKLLVADPVSQTLLDQHVFDLPKFLRRGDLLVFNDSKVFKARLRAKIGEKNLEVFLLRPEQDQSWSCLLKPARRLKIGDVMLFGEQLEATLLEKLDDGVCRIRFNQEADSVFSFADKHGEIPTPPYVSTSATDESQYQTIYAKERGSVAAPTAGFHFTSELMEHLKRIGVQMTFVTLHVGLGTFRPIKSETLGEHQMHEEWTHVSAETVLLIQRTKQAGHRVIAIGTTATRALESAAQTGLLQAFSGYTSLFITPGYKFQVIDGLMTNFHLPKSTLLVLVSALAGREFMLKAYQHAIEDDYRFYSFGDAMLILPEVEES